MHQLLIQVLEFGPLRHLDCALPVFHSQRDEEAEISFSLFLPTPRRLAQCSGSSKAVVNRFSSF